MRHTEDIKIGSIVYVKLSNLDSFGVVVKITSYYQVKLLQSVAAWPDINQLVYCEPQELTVIDVDVDSFLEKYFVELL